ncbi:MAG: NAD(P)-binding protein, partial [Gammaproteobacteria bacterium]
MRQQDIDRQTWDVIVIGSGASGGMAAWNLVMNHGVRVLMLDAGSRFNRDEFWTHVGPAEARERRRRGERPPQFMLSTREQPYFTPEGMPFE